ncbi:carbonic anhydrase [Streptomyces sp. GbtcB6]|uniref:carbonic anhydrase n=1 Tax=Streptomyces sp. GbtcB6 TaxID=2824751 RepID=UPI001C305799|nr:carbonic anhydrase [Streptomyces sp. GbtcB6]
MTEFNELLERNREFAANADLGGLAMPPKEAMPDKLLLLLTCVDPRVEPAGFLGVGTWDAGVLRNAGGRVDDKVVEDIAYLSMRLGARMDVAVIHHTQCGTGMLSEPAFRQAFADRTGLDEGALTERAVTDPTTTVRQDVAKLLANPLLSSDIIASVSGHVLRLETGLVETVVEATAPARTPAA